MTYIIDAHEDIASSALTFKRDYRQSALVIRKSEIGTPYPIWNEGEATLGWPEYQTGKVAVIFATLFATPFAYKGGDWDVMAYRNPKEAAQVWQDQLDYYSRLCNESPEKFKIILNQKDLAAVLEPWEQGTPGDHPVGLVLSFEGVEGLREPAELEEYYAKGVRLVGPVWAGTRYCGGSNEERDFDKEGFELMEVMASLGIPLDISHMREKAALTALDRFEGTIFASHANARSMIKGSTLERHLSDLTIRRLQERGGVAGVVPFSKFLVPDWTPATPRETVTIKQVAAQIDYYCQLSGNSRHVGIGSDFDGRYGSPNMPIEMETIADVQKLEPVLTEMGYTAEDRQNIFHNNWKKILEMVLPA